MLPAESVCKDVTVTNTETEGLAKPDLAKLVSGDVFTKEGTLLPARFAAPQRLPVGGWSLQSGLNGDEFHGALKSSGWKWSYIGDVLTLNCYGRLSDDLMGRSIEKTGAAVYERGANSFTLTAVEARRMLGFSTVCLSVQPWHLQRGFPVIGQDGE
jgi:hypothetical protein